MCLSFIVDVAQFVVVVALSKYHGSCMVLSLLEVERSHFLCSIIPLRFCVEQKDARSLVGSGMCHQSVCYCASGFLIIGSLGPVP
jgi:hypothetical protein